jgi:hypothetical protein
MSEFASPKLASANDKRGMPLPHHVGFCSLSADAGKDWNLLPFREISLHAPPWT